MSSLCDIHPPPSIDLVIDRSSFTFEMLKKALDCGLDRERGGGSDGIRLSIDCQIRTFSFD